MDRQVVLITGCSSGLGLRTARHAVAAGHITYAGLRDLGEPRELPEAPEDRDIRWIQLDITRAADRQQALDRIHHEQERLDALVNNAGVMMAGFLEQVEEDELRQVFEVNFFSTWALTRLALPALRRSQGIVINFSSLSGLRAFPGLGAYAASKFALEGMTEALSQEVKPFGVRVALIEPGTYATKIWNENATTCRASTAQGTLYTDMNPKLDATLKRNGTRNPGDPDDIASKVLELIGSERPPLRNLMYGNRGSRIVFERMHRQMSYSIDDE